MQRRFGLVAALLSGLLLSVGSSWAAYPEKAIKWIVPYPPAGTTDVLARIIAQTLSERLGQQARQTIVQNYDLHSVCLPQQLAWVNGLGPSLPPPPLQPATAP